MQVISTPLSSAALPRTASDIAKGGASHVALESSEPKNTTAASQQPADRHEAQSVAATSARYYAQVMKPIRDTEERRQAMLMQWEQEASEKSNAGRSPEFVRQLAELAHQLRDSSNVIGAKMHLAKLSQERKCREPENRLGEKGDVVNSSPEFAEKRAEPLEQPKNSSGTKMQAEELRRQEKHRLDTVQYIEEKRAEAKKQAAQAEAAARMHVEPMAKKQAAAEADKQRKDRAKFQWISDGRGEIDPSLLRKAEEVFEMHYSRDRSYDIVHDETGKITKSHFSPFFETYLNPQSFEVVKAEFGELVYSDAHFQNMHQKGLVHSGSIAPKRGQTYIEPRNLHEAKELSRRDLGAPPWSLR